MKKKILFMSSAKLTAFSIGLLLAVFCTIGMSFTPGEEGENLGNPNDSTYVPGPRRSHWTTSGTEGSGCNATEVTYYNDKVDYAKTISQTLGNGYTTITANSKNATPVNSTATSVGSQSYVLWNTGVTEHAASDKNKTAMSSGALTAAHTNEITFLATPSDPDEYRFAGWYSNAAGTTLVSTDNPYTASVVIPNASYGTKQTTTYESASSPYQTTYYAKFEEIPATNVIFLAASTPARDNGYYTVVGKGVNQTITTSNQTIGVKSITLTAYPSEAAVFVRWYTEDNSGDRTTLSTENTCAVSFDASTKVGIEWKELTNNHNITFKAVDLDANDNPVGTYSISSTELSATIGASDYVYNTGEAYKFTPALTATPAVNYMFYGWYTKEGEKKNYLSYSATWSPTFTEDIIVYAEFLFNGYAEEDLAQFKVGNTTFTDLNAANAACNSTNKTITLVRDGILPPGHYTISSANTLLIPYNAAGTMVTSESSFASMADQTFAAVSAYRTLTFAKGADLTVDGTLYVAAKHLSSTNVMEDASGGPGRPIGPVGRIHMSEGGHIEVNGKLYCFGFITGQNMASGNNTLDVGTITANSGAIVYENFILGDMKGGQATYTMVENEQKVFPFNSYFLQNIEVPITFNYGATEKVVTSFNPSSTNTTSTFTIIGGTNDDAMFRMHAKGATITKWYDATTDHFCVQLSGNSSLENLKLSFSMKILITVNVEVDSRDYILPIPSSMHLILDNTDVTLSNDLCLLPGAITEIRKNASLTINSNMYVYDVSQWDKYCLSKYFITYYTPFTNHLVRSTADMSQLDDAKFIVDGACTINNGKYLYSSSSGANICGNNGGKMIFSGSLPAATNAYQVKGSATGSSSDYDVKISGGVTSDVYLTAVPVVAANLHNENNTYTKSIASTTFHNVHGRWFAGAAKDADASTHVHTFTYRAGENVGTETENMNAGANMTTPAVYSWDKTGLELQQKWADVTGPVCDTWWTGKGTQSSYFYNWSLSSDWHQFTPMTSPTGWYGGSNNKLYEKSDCTWNEIGETDENCLYTIGGIKKALVDGALIELEKNTYDEAYHDAATGENFYVCFEGCNWHPAIPYPDEQEAYIVNEENFIWKDGEWLSVLRDELFFYTLNEKGIKDYYDYIDGRWQDALPLVKVTSGDQVWRGYTLLWAVSKANEVNDAVITILNNIKGENNEIIYNRANTTCTLDLNGHTVSGAVPFTDDNNRGLLKINASGTTFTITDNSANKEGRLENICNQNKVTYAVHLMAGTLNVEHGTIHAENPAQYASKDATVNDVAVKKLDACGARAVQVAAAQKLNINSGRLEAYATRYAYGIVASGNNANTTQVTVTNGEVYAEAPCAAYGISCSGKLNISGGLVEAKLNDHIVNASFVATDASNNINAHTTCYGIYMTGTANKAATSCCFGTLTMTGGTVKATSDVSANYQSNVFGINLYADFAGTGAANTKATDGTLSQKYAAKATIENAKIEVNTKASYGYGIVGYGRYNSADKSTSVIKIKNTEVDVYARAYAYGILSSCRISTGTGNGGCTNADIDLTNCDVYAETTTAEGAYAIWSSATQGAVYEYTYKDGVATATNSIYAGEYAIGANMTVHSGRYEAKTKTSSAYASGTSTKQINTYSRHSGTALYQQLGGQAEAYSTLNIEDGTFIATAGTETARAVSNGGNTTITGGTFQATATTRYAYCIYAISGTLNVSNATITATSNSNTANGIHLEGTVASYTMFAYAPTATLTNLNVTATTGSSTTARALYVAGKTLTQTEAQKEALTSSNRNNYYNIYQVGEKAIAPTVTVHGGTYTATAGTSSAYGAHSPGTSISTNKVATASPVMNLYDATFIARTGTSTSAYGVSAGGPTLIDGCTITATAGNATKYQSTASGVRAVDKTTTIKNSTITATATDAAYGLEGYVEINATHGYCFHGEFDLSEAGNTEVTAEAKTSGKKAYTIYLKSAKKNIASGNFAGDYATAASATINGGTYNAKFTTSGSAYVISLDGKQTQGSVVTQPEVEVLDGFFNGATAEVGTAGVVGHMQLKGGYFVHPTNLATYAVAPKSVWTLPNTHEHYNPYYYKIAEHYNIVFMNGTTPLQQKDMEVGSIPAYTSTPTKDADAQYTYTFDGWSTTDGGDKLASLPAVSADATYFAHYSKTERKYTVNVSAGEHGAVSPASVSNIGCETASGDITATPNVGYKFVNWTLPEGVTAADGYTVASNPIRIHAIAADKTITASFAARNDISYTVKHWQQNIANDDYTEVTADQETKQGTTATPTAAAAKSYTGFTAQPISQETIAGDGTTVVSVYYNRNTVAVTWNWNESGTPTTYSDDVKYGAAPVYTYAAPTKPSDATYNYTFTGWSDGTNTYAVGAALPAVTAATTYTATFARTENKYTVAVAAGANGSVSPASVSEIGCETASADITATPDAGYAFNGWTLPEGVTAADGYTVASNPIRIHAIAADKTITASFAARNDINYTVKHWQQNIANDDYTEVTADQETKQGTTATPTAAAAKSYTGFTAQSFEQGTIAGNGSTIVNIYYNRNTFTITWHDDNGVTIETDENVKYGATPSYDGSTPTKEQTVEHTYTFKTWSPAITSVIEDATYTAQFDEAWRKYAITWQGTDITERTDQVEYGKTPEYGEGLPTKEPTEEEVFTWKWMDLSDASIGVKPVTGDATYKGSFSGSPRPYTITFVNDDGATLKEIEVGYGSTPTYPDANPPTSELTPTYVFDGWKPEIAKVNGPATYTAVYKHNVDPIVVIEEDTVKIDGVNTGTTSTTVRVSGVLDVAENHKLTTDDLILESSANASGENASGEITGQGAITAENVYFDLYREGGFKERTWYAVAVPWKVWVPVEGKSGVSIKKGGAFEQQSLGTTFDLIYYDGARRASGEVNTWNYLEKDLISDEKYRFMTPGVAYMIYLAEPTDVIRFKKTLEKDNNQLHTDKLEVKEYPSSIHTKYANWNGIANPATYHAYLNYGVTEGECIGQVYNPDTKGYEKFEMNLKKLAVGQPIFIQAIDNRYVDADSVSYTKTTTSSSPVRRRAKEQFSLTRYELYLAPSQDIATDEVIIRMSEEKEENGYVIGQDLLKMGVSNIVPQMWIDRYESKMFINTVAPDEDNTADYPLGIFVPQNGEYDLFLDDELDSESNLYLTYDGEAIWNLTYGPYVASLEKGTNTHYGLRIVKKAPQATTGIEETTIQNGESVRKVLVNDKVYIIRNGVKYSVTGQKAK